MSDSAFTFPVVSFRHLETPFQAKGYRDYFAVVNTSQLPDLAEWREINVRDPKLSSPVAKAIRSSFQTEPDMFVFLNRGIVLAVEKISFDNKSNQVTIALSDPKRHGLLDGGHTYRIVRDETPNLETPQFVRIEFIEGLNREDITDVVEARNTSTQVKDQSLYNLQERFKDLENHLQTASYKDLIAFSEYEEDAQGNPKPIDIREIIAILTTFDCKNFNDTNHPIIAYSSKAQALAHFASHHNDYAPIYPLAQEILALYDHVRNQMRDLYNNTGGKFGNLTGVVQLKRTSQPLYFIDAVTKWVVPDGFTYPFVAAFRALLVQENGRYLWGKGLNPTELLRGNLGGTLAKTIGDFALEHRNPTKTGKSVSVWNACYSAAKIAYLQASNSTNN